MKKLLTIPTLFLSLTIYASPCQRLAQQDDAEFKAARVASYKCEFSWKEGGKKHTAEIVYLKNYCLQMEGGTKIDCLMTRTCPTDKKIEPEYGRSLYLTKGVSKALCAYGDSYFFGNEGAKEFHSFVKCIKKNPKYFILESPAGKRQRCTFPKKN